MYIINQPTYTMKKLSIFPLLCLGIMLGFTACNDDDDPVDPATNAPEINAVNTSYEGQPGNSVNIQLNVNAGAGIQSLTVAGAAEGTVDYDASDDNQIVSYAFGVPADASEGQAYELTFTLTDTEGRTDAADVTVTATATPSAQVEVNPDANGLADLEGFDTESNTYTMISGNTYVLDGFVFVQEGQTLVIEPGTIIKGRPGQGGGASAIVVSRGGRIEAEGTAEAPIIMTGLADDLQGSVPNDTEALWGGLIVLGSAPTNNQAEGFEKAIEGLPTDGLDGDPLYGGDNADDDSGVIKYVSIRHGGSLIGGDNEINGLTLGGVGAGTTIEYVEVWSNLDDGIEWFGGTVNAKYLVSSWIGDDALDYDEGFAGKVQHALIWSNEANVKDDSWGGEHDGGVGTNEGLAPFAKPVLYNVTYIGAANMLGALLYRDNAGGECHNSIFTDFENGVSLEIRSDIQSSYDRLVAGDLKLENNLWFNVADNTPESIFTIITGGTVADAALNTATANFASYFTEAGNQAADPEFSGGIVPAASEAVTTGLSDYPSDGFFTPVEYKGAFAPGETPWIAGWTKTWEVLNN